MDISFEFVNQSDIKIDGFETLCLSLIQETFNQVDFDSDCELSLIIVDNKEIHHINKTYRNIDRETDVISFALEDNEDFFLEGMPRSLGDIFISIDKAREQAESYQHSLERELAFLFVHGLLHLLGYDHMEEADEKEMFTLQEAILDAQNIKRN